MMRTTWNVEAMRRRKCGKPNCPLAPTGKEAKHILDSIMCFGAHLMEKMRALVGIHYQLHSNTADYLKTLRTNWTLFDPNPDEPEIGRFIAPVIVLAIKSFFFSGADTYSLGRKPHTSHFFLPFCGEMIRVVCAMFAVAIEDLEVRLSNSNPPVGKSAIWLEPSAQKGENGAYARLGKTWAKTPLLRQDRIVTILRKRVLKQAVGGVEGKSEITAIPNRYKDTLDDLIDSSDAESPDRPNSPARPGLIDKGSRNASRSRSGSPTLLEDDRLDEDVPLTSAPKIRASQVHQPHDVIPHGVKSGRAQYGTLAIDKTASSTKATVRKRLDVATGAKRRNLIDWDTIKKSKRY